MATLSSWRKTARRVIAEALAALPEDAPKTAVLRAIRESYPFGERAMYPYKAFLLERKRALEGRYGGEARIPAEHPGDVHYRLAPHPASDALPWLSVVCPWCDGRIAGGCLVCGGHHARVREVVGRPDFLSLRRNLGPGEEGVLADWLADVAGIEVERGAA